MVGVITDFADLILEAYNSFLSLLPLWVQNFVGLFLLVLVIVIYAIFVWKFYTFIARKNIIGLNLSQYNKANHPLLVKMTAVGLYFVEYILVLPVLVFFWFAVFTLFLMFLIENSIPMGTILLISATVIAAIRMTSYYRKELSQDVAKLFPFTLLAVAVLEPGFFKENFLERVASRIIEIPDFLGLILTYLVFIVLLEAVLRFFYFLISFMGLEEAPELKERLEEEEE